VKIISLIAENVKKLTAVEIRPDGNMVVISGANGAGKTSVLDSIYWALSGATHIQAVPIRKGANEAHIKLDLGELKVTRHFKRGTTDAGMTTSIVVESVDGARFPSPQKMLDALLDSLAFDPLAFARMDAREQFDALRAFVPEVDFDAIANADRGDRERRTELGRQARQERSAAQLITTPPDTPEQELDEAALVQALEGAGAKNAELEQRKARREAAGKEMVSEERAAESLRAQAEDLRRQAAELDKKAGEATDRAKALRAKLDEAPELPAPIDTGAISAAIAQARATNANVRRLNERMKHHAAAEELDKQVEACSAAIAARQAAKEKAIAAAKLPVDGLSLGEGVVLFDGLPFEQASDAEQLRVSCAIAMANNPKLRVIRVRDGSLLDENAMLLLARMADERDFQVWCERVDSTGKVGFVLEDGHVRKAEAETAVPEKAQEQGDVRTA
jgi:DNA repair exonuclease SbcCD ATPase subunit